MGPGSSPPFPLKDELHAGVCPEDPPGPGAASRWRSGWRTCSVALLQERELRLRPHPLPHLPLKVRSGPPCPVVAVHCVLCFQLVRGRESGMCVRVQTCVCAYMYIHTLRTHTQMHGFWFPGLISRQHVSDTF